MAEYKVVKMNEKAYETFKSLAELQGKTLLALFDELAEICDFLINSANTKRYNHFSIGKLKDETHGIIALKLLQLYVGTAENDEEMKRKIEERM